MCELCRHNPCVSNCPNAPEAEPVFICDECEAGIYAGEPYYDIGGHKYCEGCIEDARYIAEEPEEDEPYELDPYDEWRDRQLDGVDDAEYFARSRFGGD